MLEFSSSEFISSDSKQASPNLLRLKILPASAFDPKISGAKIAKTAPTSLFSKIGTKKGGRGGWTTQATA